MSEKIPKNRILNVSHLNVQQGKKIILADINFEIQKGEFVYLIGKTGSGKSSLLRTLYADLYFKKGEIELVDFEVHKLPAKKIPFLRREIGIIFQDFQLFADRDVFNNLYFVLEAVGETNAKKIEERIQFVLEQVGMESKITKFPHQLSGGEQQRISIARALLNSPKIIFADEPTGNLDPNVAHQIMDVLQKINAQGTAVLMATHHHAFLREYPARVLFCQDEQVSDIDREEVIRKMEV